MNTSRGSEPANWLVENWMWLKTAILKKIASHSTSFAEFQVTSQNLKLGLFSLKAGATKGILHWGPFFVIS